ncbi:hypothetical protein ABQE45_20620 [Mycobacteroides chelonae]|uniref:Uncharacterized protein n=1 Tax=Mycobacteroides chelonae TaxID=1774 RepID=A0A1S1MAK1_MYCCH|nr:hypothetical protein [Mycobacteroides chelonae]OHU62960.1 hypothetical protein BKG85_16055 [Mycobacteroides chelonae]OHU78955.1 hypothetical protein BKG84_11705 [Mycobacteroides chelonae]QQG85830.1 hypothetical protein HBA99_00045 [Mycobacteroides chelonae]QQG90646.1 hypothetical protein HBA97_00045 [Mycobacteroides chelonae]
MIDIPDDPDLRALVLKVADGVAEMEAARLEAERFIETPIEPVFQSQQQEETPLPLLPTSSELEEDDFYAFNDPFGRKKWK